MAKSKKQKYTPGFQDIEMMLEYLDNEHRKDKRIAWLKKKFGGKSKMKGGEQNDILGSSNIQTQKGKG